MTNPPPRRVIPLKLERTLTLSAAERKAVLEACERGKALPGGLLEILHAVQELLGFVPPDAVPLIAHELNLSRAEVHGVVSFYHYFRTERAGRHVVHICRAEACQSMGSERVAEKRPRVCLGGAYPVELGDGRGAAVGFEVGGGRRRVLQALHRQNQHGLHVHDWLGPLAIGVGGRDPAAACGI